MAYGNWELGKKIEFWSAYDMIVRYIMEGERAYDIPLSSTLEALKV